jgi:hypothetical protein
MHSGTYVVNATNPAGSDTSSFNVTVTGEHLAAYRALNLLQYLFFVLIHSSTQYHKP